MCMYACLLSANFHFTKSHMKEEENNVEQVETKWKDEKTLNV